MQMKRNPILGQTRNIIIIFISIAALMVTSAVIELKQSKNELLQLMTTQAHSLLESLIIASKNTLQSYEYLENIERQRLLNNAVFIRKLYEKHKLTNKVLREIGSQNAVYHIIVFNKQKKQLFSSLNKSLRDSLQKNAPLEILDPIFRNEVDTLYIGFRTARLEKGYRYVVALAANDRSAIVLNIDASHFLELKKQIGFGALLRSVVKGSPSIIYIALQDTTTILAGSGNLSNLKSIFSSEFLTKSYTDSLFLTHSISSDSFEVFEAVHPFTYKGNSIGLFRIGLSMQPIHDINERIFRRLIIITIVLVIIGFILFTYIFTRQRLDILHKQYQVVETYSGSIIDNVSDAIIVYNKEEGIMIFNDAAAALFGKDKKDVIKKPPKRIFREPGCKEIIKKEFEVKQHVCTIGHEKKYLFISKSEFYDSKETVNTILVIRDLTEQRNLEQKMERKQRLTAMGELASGVAHEIRNPLNAIGTIVQQLDKDFEPQNEKEEYHDLVKIVYSEVKRIDETIKDFLRFARPEPISPEKFNLQDLFKELHKQYRSLMDEKNITLKIESKWSGSVKWDKRQMKQVFINLLINAIDAINKEGNITISSESLNDKEVSIKISDNGHGMSNDVQENIFNLYYTTKAKGSGIGLSIVQRIVYEHHGLITVESEMGKGTTFLIQMPISVDI